MVEQYKRKPNASCLICKKDIYRRPSEIEAGRVFCGMLCYGLSCRKESPCVICEKPILSSLHKKTCSRSCSNKLRAGIRYRLNGPRDKVATLRRIKIKLFSLRGEKCARCNYSQSEVLQVHHKNRNREDNTFENLELICPNCHYEEHYAKKNRSFKK